MFKFAFIPEDAPAGPDLARTAAPLEVLDHRCEEIPPDDAHVPPLAHASLEQVFGIRTVPPIPVITPDRLEVDLVPGEYEGGHVVWEGSLDLCRYLRRLYDTTPRLPASLRVLELGCGAAVPSIYLASLGVARQLILSDFNAAVLRSTTWPNIQLNLPTWRTQNIRCFAGDWAALASHLAAHQSAE